MDQDFDLLEGIDLDELPPFIQQRRDGLPLVLSEEEVQFLVELLDEEEEVIVLDAKSRFANLDRKQKLAALAAIIDDKGIGLCSEQFGMAMDKFKSEDFYMKELCRFADFYLDGGYRNINNALLHYFDEKAKLVHPLGHKLAGKNVYRANTLRGSHSVFVKLYLLTGRGHLKTSLPIIEINITKQSKLELVTKAKTLTRTELCK